MTGAIGWGALLAFVALMLATSHICLSRAVAAHYNKRRWLLCHAANANITPRWWWSNRRIRREVLQVLANPPLTGRGTT
jgi:hypothetical protein